MNIKSVKELTDAKIKEILFDKLVVHDHYLVDDVKMSKSLGNTINPLKLLNKVYIIFI